MRAVHFRVTKIRKGFQQVIAKSAVSTNYYIQLFHTLKTIFQK